MQPPNIDYSSESILVVENDSDFWETIVGSLSELGFTVEATSESADALKELDAFRWVKIYLSRSQTADRTFQWVVKG